MKFEEDWEEIKENICLICSKKIKDNQKQNPIGNTHYDCWLYLPYE